MSSYFSLWCILLALQACLVAFRCLHQLGVLGVIASLLQRITLEGFSCLPGPLGVPFSCYGAWDELHMPAQSCSQGGCMLLASPGVHALGSLCHHRCPASKGMGRENVTLSLCSFPKPDIIPSSSHTGGK